MPNDYKPPHDDADVFARYKAHYEGERELKPAMLESADRALKAGATVGQLAAWTGLTPEVFRRRARALGVERKRPPTVGKLAPTPDQPPVVSRAEKPPARASDAKRQRRPEPEPRDGRPLTDEEAKSLADLARSRAGEMQRRKLEQIAADGAKGYEDYAIVSSALDMGLLTHDEVYGAGPVRPDEEPK